MLIWVTVAGYTFHDVPSASNIDGHLILWVPAAAASLLLMSMASRPRTAAPSKATVSASDSRWNVGRRYWILCAALPVFLLCLTELSLGMQDGPLEGMGRKRFGPDAYWRRVERLFGEWNAVGKTGSADAPIVRTTELPVASVTFDENRGVTVTLPSGEAVDTHRWYISNPNVWIRWHGRLENHPDAGEALVQFRDDGLLIAWPANAHGAGFVYFEREE